MAITIAVSNQKGGVGKTTTTANLGASLAELGQRVLAIDLDPQGNLTAAFGLDRQVDKSVADSLLDRACTLPVISAENAVVRGLSISPATIALAAAEAVCRDDTATGRRSCAHGNCASGSYRFPTNRNAPVGAKQA